MVTWLINDKNEMANKDFLLKVLKRFYQNFNFWKILNFDKNRDNEKVFHFFPNFKSKVCSQDFSKNEQEVDFLSDLVIFK